MSAVRPLRPLTLVAAIVTDLVVALGLVSTVSTAGAAPGSASAEDPELTNFPGRLAVRPSTNVYTKLAQLPVGYRSAARAWLDAEATEKCPNSPLIKVASYHRDGFVTASHGWYAATGEPRECSRGGYWAHWSKRGGWWHEVIRDTEGATCRQLVYHQIPHSMESGCFGEGGEWVDY
jgi:hypothetical protein